VSRDCVCGVPCSLHRYCVHLALINQLISDSCASGLVIMHDWGVRAELAELPAFLRRCIVSYLGPLDKLHLALVNERFFFELCRKVG
jgi:hypothetical protein